MEKVATASIEPKQRLVFAYDAKGRRIQKKAFSWTGSVWQHTDSRRFYYDGWNLLAEVDDNDHVIRSYMWGLDLAGSREALGGIGALLATHTASGATHFYMCDAQGNVMTTCGQNGTPTAQYEYGPFGETIRRTGSFAAENPFRFSTKYEDGESQYVNFGKRLYSNGTGRWFSRDPISESGGTGLYIFTNNDPLARYEILGMWGADVHNDKTGIWVCQGKIPAETSVRIAAADEAVDGLLNGVTWNNWRGTSYLPKFGTQAYHFNDGQAEGDTRLQLHRKHLGAAVNACKCDDVDQAIDQFGISLHPLQDISAHGDYGYSSVHRTQNERIWVTHNLPSPQSDFGPPETYPDRLDLDVTASADGIPWSQYLTATPSRKLEPGKLGGGDYAIYKRGNLRHQRVWWDTFTAANTFRSRLQGLNLKKTSRCYNAFGLSN